MAWGLQGIVPMGMIYCTSYISFPFIPFIPMNTYLYSANISTILEMAVLIPPSSPGWTVFSPFETRRSLAV
ncbi:hypothetical protein ASPTUDRAFT_40095, partial [Aspergillus tubingensis CBS 134.48]